MGQLLPDRMLHRKQIVEYEGYCLVSGSHTSR